MSAALLGSSAGLGLGVLYMTAGLSDHAAEHAAEVRMADAAYTYPGSHLEARGAGMRMGLDHFSFQGTVDTRMALARFADERRAAKVRKRAELECMTQAVYYEARSEDARGQAAVAQVVLNRVKHPAFPKSVCGVVFQGSGHPGCQFSFACDGSMRRHRESAAWDRARGVAKRAMAGQISGSIGSATHYHTTAVSPFWAPQMLRVAQVGVHVFYKFSPYRNRALPAAAPAMQQAVLTSGPTAHVPELRVSATMDKAVEASLAPVSPDAAKSQPAPKPAEAAMLTTPQTAGAGAS
jgi:hypothetical protein